MKRSTNLWIPGLTLALTAGAAVVFASCDRSPPSEPGVAEFSKPQAVQPPRTTDVTVTLFRSEGAVLGRWNITHYNADNGKQVSSTINCTGGACQAVLAVPVGSDGCFVARPIFPASNFPLLVPPPNPLQLTNVTPNVGGQALAAVMTAKDGPGGYTSAPLTGAEFANSCVSDGVIVYNNGGQGPNPIVLSPPNATQVSFSVLNPAGNPVGGGGADGYGLIPLCASGLPAAWRNQATSDGWQSAFQGLAIAYTGNPGSSVPLFVHASSWGAFPCNPPLPFFVVESDIVSDPNSTGTQLTGTRKFFAGEIINLAGEGVETEHLLCKQEVAKEALSDGDPTKVDFRGVNPTGFTIGSGGNATTFDPFEAIKYGFQAAFGPNQSLTPLTNPSQPNQAAVAVRYQHVGDGSATLSVRARNTPSGTISGNFPYTCSGGSCTFGAGTGSLASLPGFAATPSVSDKGLVGSRQAYGITWSLTGLPSTAIEFGASTAGDGIPNASKASGKKPQISSAFISIPVPAASECSDATNDDRWFSK